MPDYMALDPGLTTGWAILHEDGRHESGQLTVWETYRAVEKFCERDSANVLVAEKFTITARTAQLSQAPWSLELIGVARKEAWKLLDTPLVTQTPAQAKGFSSDARLRHLGWWLPGKGHANDASRHLLLYAATHRLSQVDIALLVDV